MIQFSPRVPFGPQFLACWVSHCEQTIENYGDHALCCRKTRDTVTRHSIVRNWVFRLAKDGLLCPEIEKVGVGPAETSRRPADVALPIWANGKGLAIDVAIVCPLAPSHLDEIEPCESYAWGQKHRLYDAGFIHSQYDFVAMVFESGGAVNEEGEAILKQLFRFASKRSTMSHSRFAGRAWSPLVLASEGRHPNDLKQ